MEERNFLRPAVSLAMLLSGILMNALNVGWFSAEWVKVVWYVAAFMPVGLGVMREAAEEAAKGDVFSEFMLMSVASVGAFLIGEYPEGVAVMLFYCIGETLQDMAVDRARDNIKSMMEFRPDHALVVVDGQTVSKRPEDVRIGDTIEVRPGERVPLDGELTSAAAAFNTAALTGESVPRTIDTGMTVSAGMIATDTTVRLRVTHEAKDSAIARILNMVEEASNRKAPAELFIRKFARVYTPAVIGLAVLTALLPYVWSLIEPQFSYSFSTWFYRALVFLVISCPCALVISVPLSYFAGIGAASKQGVLFKGGNWLDAITHVDTVVFDKTGTLTTGEFHVEKVVANNRDKLLAIVATMEDDISHPIAKAIVKAAGDARMELTDVHNHPGKGVSARQNGRLWTVGTTSWLASLEIDFPEELVLTPETVVCCACEGIYEGHILLSDTLKEDSHAAVENIKAAGVNKVCVLSGDKYALVKKVANELQADEFRGDSLPEDKVRFIEQLKNKGHRVAFVGDGINDAPVLAASDVGIAMGSIGSDMAVETADIVLQDDRPSKVATAITTGRRTTAIVRQNIIFAISVKLLIMLLGLIGAANLWAAVFADVGVALLAVLNSMRIFFSKGRVK